MKGRLNSLIPRQRDIRRMTNYTRRRIREPIPAEKKHEALKIANGKCQYPRCSVRVGLVFHHRNLKNDDNRLSNIEVLCPNHHGTRHRGMKRKIKTNLIGQVISSRLVKAKKGENKKKPSKRRGSHAYFLGQRVNVPRFQGY